MSDSTMRANGAQKRHLLIGDADISDADIGDGWSGAVSAPVWVGLTRGVNLLE